MGLTVGPGTATIIQGLPGSGKTTLQRQLIAAHLRAGASVFVQDPDHQFSDLVPVYETARAYRAAARAAGAAGAAFPRGAAVAEVDDEPMTALALEVAAQAKAEGRYTVIAYDEAVLAASSSHVSGVHRDAIARRRHRALSLLLNAQDFGQVHALWQRLATEIFVFRCSDRDRVKAIAARWGRDPDRLWRALSQLPQHQWARLSHGR